MRFHRRIVALLAAGGVLIPALMIGRALSSDHADTPQVVANPGTDLTDVFIFPSPSNPANVVLVMTVNPLIPQGQAAGVFFDPTVLYQFKIDNTGDAVEDLVIQAKFGPQAANQIMSISGPTAPLVTGTSSRLLPNAASGNINQAFSPSPGVQVFAGARSDPFFFDLERFFMILPDRATPITGQPDPTPNTPKATSWRPPGQAKDFLAGFNLLAIVVEVPKAQLIGNPNGQISLWCTTSK